MEDFDSRLAQLLKARPGLTKERLAAVLEIEYDDTFREQLGLACDKKVAHKVQDKYYPGTLKTY
jgi:hypothetical protein